MTPSNNTGPLLIKYSTVHRSEGVCHLCGTSFFEYDTWKITDLLWYHLDIAHVNLWPEDDSWTEGMPGPDWRKM